MRRLRFAPLLLLAGCATTPQPHPNLTLPPARTSTTVTPPDAPAQQLVVGAPVQAAWWHAFGSAKLDALVAQALATNNDIAAADAALRQSRELARAAAGGQGPQLDASYQAQRARVSAALSTPLADPSDYLYTLHTAQLTVAYPLDVFGGGRAKVRSARAAADAAAARRDAARSTVVANLVVAVIQHAALSAQIEAAQATIRDDADLVTLLERRRALGDVGEADVAAQQTVLATAQAALPPLERQRDHQAALIVSLLGRPAGGVVPDLPAMSELVLPGTVPVALPAAIVAARPDVRAAEAQMRGAAADLGSAIAARLPSFQLSGTAGGAASHFLDMFATGNPFFSLIGGVTQPLFHSGQLRHQQHAAEAALQQAEAQYRAAAIQAFLDVDDALSGLRTDGDALAAAARADDAAQRTLTMTRRQVQLGGVGTLALLNASAAASQARLQRLQASAARLVDTVALYQACGTPVGATGS
ncbi:MAG: efflux transporter outer membrane subunit [Sphingomonas sp.]|uniref:efflux transporter outer membrane subunit n=1 Tax=Sphingomonas sp. TaxID=28214 RepID=UPI001AC64DD5|nr:efflux transporter outer membrane subunit [Sphingomonas sp.]MBN8807539.1 efflux transporter outer membrane subunit [Sphingomonas sp.]